MLFFGCKIKVCLVVLWYAKMYDLKLHKYLVAWNVMEHSSKVCNVETFGEPLENIPFSLQYHFSINLGKMLSKH